MDDRPPAPPLLVVWAAAFEGGLAIVAVVLGRWLGAPPLATFSWNAAAIGWGLLATLPMFALLAAALACPWRVVRDVIDVLEKQLTPLFAEARAADLAIICLLAGVGEEMLFRGVAQAALAASVAGPASIWLGLFGGALLFAAAHPITPGYFVIAGVIGFYLGAVWLLTGNLLAPIVAHAVYDFVTLLYFIRLRAKAASSDTT